MTGKRYCDVFIGLDSATGDWVATVDGQEVRGRHFNEVKLQIDALMGVEQVVIVDFNRIDDKPRVLGIKGVWPDSTYGEGGVRIEPAEFGSPGYSTGPNSYHTLIYPFDQALVDRITDIQYRRGVLEKELKNLLKSQELVSVEWWESQKSAEVIKEANP